MNKIRLSAVDLLMAITLRFGEHFQEEFCVYDDLSVFVLYCVQHKVYTLVSVSK